MKSRLVGIVTVSILILTLSVQNIFVGTGDKANAIEADNNSVAAASGAASISLAITSSKGSNDANIAIQSSLSGGVTTGYHTLNVVSNSENGYVVNMSVAPNGTDLKSSDSKNTDTIPSTTATLSNPAALPDNT